MNECMFIHGLMFNFHCGSTLLPPGVYGLERSPSRPPIGVPMKAGTMEILHLALYDGEDSCDITLTFGCATGNFLEETRVRCKS